MSEPQADNLEAIIAEMRNDAVTRPFNEKSCRRVIGWADRLAVLAAQAPEATAEPQLVKNDTVGSICLAIECMVLSNANTQEGNDQLRRELMAVSRGCRDTVPPQAAQAQEGWQTIETAPTDGTLIQVWAPSAHGLPAMHSLCTYHPDAGFCIDELREPTHWMPLPLAPGGPR